jgi:hypothetical protein
MDSKEFRAASELVAEAKRFFDSALWRAMLLAVESEAPHNQPPTNAHIIVEPAASYGLGEIHGWVKCLKTLQSLGTFPQKQAAEPEPTYQNSEEPNA